MEFSPQLLTVFEFRIVYSLYTCPCRGLLRSRMFLCGPKERLSFEFCILGYCFFTHGLSPAPHLIHIHLSSQSSTLGMAFVFLLFLPQNVMYFSDRHSPPHWRLAVTPWDEVGFIIYEALSHAFFRCWIPADPRTLVWKQISACIGTSGWFSAGHEVHTCEAKAGGLSQVWG